MTDSTAATSSEPSTPSQPPAVVRGLLFFGVLAAILGGVYVAFVRDAPHGGTITFDAPVTSAVDLSAEARVVPGRENEILDRADVWTIDLLAGEPVTVHVCAGSRSGRATHPSPNLLVHGPGGPADHRVDSTRGTLSPSRAAIVYTPTSSGEHAIWVYKKRNQTEYSYHLEVLRGAHPEPSGDLCALPY